jgi:peptidoglycan/xylan/chitin deacetylase (PgdA/CDA1 family)
MVELRRLFGIVPPNPEDLPMRAADVRRLVSNRISVGAHGCTHQPLTSLPAPRRVEEIQRSRLEVEALSALPVTGFAYPHGDRDPETIEMVRQAGYRWACSTCENTINPLSTDLYDLPRIAVGNWEVNMLFAKLDVFNEARRP